MGYTHYFRDHETITNEEWDNFAEKAIELTKSVMKKGVVLYTYSTVEDRFLRVTDAKQVLSEESSEDPFISIQGNTECNLDHEPFFFSKNEGEDSGFCKTNRKPYDRLVAAILIAAHNTIQGLNLSSDGSLTTNYGGGPFRDCDKEWHEAITLLLETFPDQDFKIPGFIVGYDHKKGKELEEIWVSASSHEGVTLTPISWIGDQEAEEAKFKSLSINQQLEQQQGTEDSVILF